MNFSEITNTESPEFAEAMQIYQDCFPVNEQHPVEIIRQRVNQGVTHIYINRANNEISFVALLWPLTGTDFILLDYMATHARHRGKNIASSFMKSMEQLSAEQKKYFILEVEDPAHGNNKDEREKRVNFYRKNGAKLLNNVRYILPALQGTEQTEMLLMMFPEYKDDKIEKHIVEKLIVQIYKELYNRDAPGILINTLRNDPRQFIELT